MLGLGEVGDGTPGFRVLMDAPARLEVGPGLFGLTKGSPCLGECRGQVGRSDAADGFRSDSGLGEHEGSDPYPFLISQLGDGLAGESFVVGQSGVDGPAGGALGRPIPPQVLGALSEVVGDQECVGGLTGPAHRHIGELSPAAVGKEMCPLHRLALGAMNDGRNAKTGLGVVLERDALGTDLYRRPLPAWHELDSSH